jgi:hypothetical protein
MTRRVIRSIYEPFACPLRPKSDVGYQWRQIEGPVEASLQIAIQAPKARARIMRYELTDHEWTAIKPMLPNKPRGVIWSKGSSTRSSTVAGCNALRQAGGELPRFRSTSVDQAMAAR